MKSVMKMFEVVVLLATIGVVMVGCLEPDSDLELTALTGTVSISGTAQVGQTLTANTSTLGGSGTISYQWRRGGDTDIGSNTNTYTVQTADIGSIITVIVTRSGNSGSVTSTPTATVTIESTATPGLIFQLIWGKSEYSVSYNKYSGLIGEVVIPAVHNGLPVTSIGDSAFSDCFGLTSVTIPNSVTSIGSHATYSNLC